MPRASVRAPRPRGYRAVLRGPRILDAIALAPDAGKASVDKSLTTTLGRTCVLDISADPPPPPVDADAHRARLEPLLALEDVLARAIAGPDDDVLAPPSPVGTVVSSHSALASTKSRTGEPVVSQRSKWRQDSQAVHFGFRASKLIP
jgi:hypothetical protein